MNFSDSTVITVYYCHPGSFRVLVNASEFDAGGPGLKSQRLPATFDI